ncbi:hypothetical protein LY632_10700 [Erythrobacter sp. SDW2]|uniref:hypothetical protein n=1 Tax=Erythrobacter sp. SDW2 TaxID=2907154 RepID=UPI001F21CE29|nr:hypothetical protein [Erythrobacter sp. SDW2]UIP06157.1 hypothetical protein LY632_10700 [Erythrobacter sp. SDW2]
MTDNTSKDVPPDGGKRPYSKPVLQRMDASETETGTAVFTQEVLVYYTPPS